MGWDELKALPFSWYVGLAWILPLAEETGRWPEGLLDAYITMIPKEAVMRLPCRKSLVSLMGP